MSVSRKDAALIEPPRSILMICLPGMGDTILASPSIRALKQTYPDAHITALTMLRGAKAVLDRDPHVDEVLYFNFIGEGVLRSLRFVLGLRKRRFDVSIFGYPSNRLEYNVIALLIGAKVRFGHRYRQFDWPCGNWLHRHSVREHGAVSNIEENVRLAQLVTGGTIEDLRAELHLSDEDLAYGKEWLRERDVEGKTLIGFHPGCNTLKNHAERRWPAERFAALGRVMTEKGIGRVLVFGGPEEAELKQEVVDAVGDGAICVVTDELMQTLGVLAHCHHFVCNDSGLMHCASALGVSTTAIFGPTGPRWLDMPGIDRDVVTLSLPCQPCFCYSPRHLSCIYDDYRCIRDISVEQVAEHLLRRFPVAVDSTE